MPAFRAGCLAFSIKFKSVAIFAHPADLACRVTDNQGVVGNMFGHHGSSSYECKLTDIVAANDGCIGANACSLAYLGLSVLAAAINGRSGVNYVGEDTRRP